MRQDYLKTRHGDTCYTQEARPYRTEAGSVMGAIPGQIVDSVKAGECILFLGAMASAPSLMGCCFSYSDGERPPSGAALSRHLAQICGYPDEDVTNLQKVSLYFEYCETGGRESLIQEIRKQVGAPNIRVSPALRMLAALPFRISITTNYDQLFESALRETEIAPGHKKQPMVRIYNPKREDLDHAPLDPRPERPVLLKLHGDIDLPPSIVITEEDYITFISRMASEHFHPIHKNIRARMNSWPILFVGYSLKDYNLRLLFKTIRFGLDNSEFPLSFSVDPFADKIIVSIFERGERRLVSFIQQDLWDFVPALYRACTNQDYPS
jgi:hypothetical protein